MLFETSFPNPLERIAEQGLEQDFLRSLVGTYRPTTARRIQNPDYVDYGARDYMLFYHHLATAKPKVQEAFKSAGNYLVDFYLELFTGYTYLNLGGAPSDLSDNLTEEIAQNIFNIVTLFGGKGLKADGKKLFWALGKESTKDYVVFNIFGEKAYLRDTLLDLLRGSQGDANPDHWVWSPVHTAGFWIAEMQREVYAEAAFWGLVRLGHNSMPPNLRESISLQTLGDYHLPQDDLKPDELARVGELLKEVRNPDNAQTSFFRLVRIAYHNMPRSFRETISLQTYLSVRQTRFQEAF